MALSAGSTEEREIKRFPKRLANRTDNHNRPQVRLMLISLLATSGVIYDNTLMISESVTNIPAIDKWNRLRRLWRNEVSCSRTFISISWNKLSGFAILLCFHINNFHALRIYFYLSYKVQWRMLIHSTCTQQLVKLFPLFHFNLSFEDSQSCLWSTANMNEQHGECMF